MLVMASLEITSVVNERENEEHDTSTDKTSQRDSTFDSSLDRTDLEITHISSSDSLLLAKSTLAYVVGLFHISRKIVIEHLTFAAGEARDGFCQVAFDHKNVKIPTAACDWIVRHFSRAGDYVVDLF